MHIKIIRQCILFVLLGLVGSISVAAETRFCVINKVGRDVVLSAKIDTSNSIDTAEEDAFFAEDKVVGTLNHVADLPGITSSAHPYNYLNTGCIVLETMGGGHDVSVAPFVPFVPLYSGEKPPLPSPSSKKLTILRYHITAKPVKGHYEDIECKKTYPAEWIWPDNSVATVSLKEGKMVCDLEINPVEKKQEPSLREIILKGDVNM